MTQPYPPVTIERVEGVPRLLLTVEGSELTVPALRIAFARRACSVVQTHDSMLPPRFIDPSVVQARLNDFSCEVGPHGLRLIAADPWDRCRPGYGIDPAAARSWLSDEPAQELLGAFCAALSGAALRHPTAQRSLALLLRGLRRLPVAYEQIIVADCLRDWQPTKEEQARLLEAEDDDDLESFEADLLADAARNHVLVLEDLVPTLRRWQERLRQR